MLSFSSSEPRPPETIQLLEKFAAVFDLTYTRFLDLQKAEAQVKEAQVQTSLERVRASAMAMHKSEDLLDVCETMYKEFLSLGFSEIRNALINIHNDADNSFVNYDYGELTGKNFNRFTNDILPFVGDIIRTSQSAEDAFSESYLTGKALAEFKELRKRSAQKDDSRLNRATELYFYFYSIGIGSIGISTFEKITEEKKALLKRFRNVFNLSYQRYVDISKAEVQAREAQIEAALERVRSKAMAMHKSEDLNPAVAVVFDELEKLNPGILRCGIAILDKEKPRGDIWITVKSGLGNNVQVSGDESMEIHPLLQGAYQSWRRQEDFSYILQGEDLINYYGAIEKIKFQLPISETFRTTEQQLQYYLNAVFPEGSLFVFQTTTITDEQKLVIKRFANVFNLTYKRFLDIQKAEAQAREAQIEVALERVRSKAMAMHKSEDLNAAVAVVFEELEKLNLAVLRCGISVLNKETRTGDIWVAAFNDKGSAIQVSGDESFDIHPLLQNAFDAWLRQEDYYYVLEGDDLTNYYKAVKVANFILPESQMVSSEKQFKKQHCNVAVYHAGGLFAFQETEFTEEAKKVMKRFANVFDLTYKRFLDLQKAEAQAREAQIEVSLERIRARTMAMHRSDELVEASAVLFHELKKLGIETVRSGFGVYDVPGRCIKLWLTALSGAEEEKSVTGTIPIDAHKSIYENYQAWSENKTQMIHEFIKDDVKDYYQKVGGYMSLPPRMSYPDKLVFSAFFFAEGSLNVMSEAALSEQECAVMIRFANVFGLTYRRFLDLQKAEENAREAQIEAALEKVRGKAMAMSNSEDLSAAASIAFTELRKLGINPLRFGVGLLSKESRKAQLYSAVSSAEGDGLALVGWVMLTGHPVLEEIYQSWLRNEDIFPELSGTQLKSYYEQLLSGLSVPSVPDWQHEEKQFGHFFPFSVGCLYAWAEKPFDETEIKILKRFASIIDLTFRRYMDLQKSEANAREAVKQAALDRVRAEIASMRKVNDLDRITPLIWNELTILGVPFVRCGVFIMDDEQKLIHTFLSTPDGKAIGAFHLPYITGGNIPRVLENWQTKSIYTDHWDEVAFTDFANELVKQGALKSSAQYLSTLPKGGFYLHFLPFVQGMLYVGSLEPLTDEQIKLVQAVADAFSTAYARYEDFNKLEAAKKQVEETLVDLKQTQQQLVQSEKMASLGELTAGIAHEIQNPLNFVNNFSEVSSELLEEMKQELAIGNRQLANEIASDVKQNLEKILHHGKRADAIVKSMLQHSRSSSGKKELTDINVLADEYLRLAYHGLRAKDKSFNAKFESHLDNSIGKLNVVPQEIGRVILNLINNAFYAVTEKKKSVVNGYEPVVTITTKNFGDKISISVNDNGNGIPQKLLDKIFQPFFTTKPTGQGTGLGLSLSYDIVTKGHGGELRVETKEGEGSEFIIQLPYLTR